jgi:serine/threonine-protein kinase
MAPQQIGQFAILAELAQSAGGVVYKANDPKGKTVALRIVRLDAPGAAEIVPGFRAAAKAASGLSSPNVAAIFGGGETEGVFFVAVEFVEGVKLSSTLAKGQTMSMSEVLDLCRQVCTGLDHAHSKGILHPELKPSNIIVEWDGTAKIMDFGVPRQHPAGEMSEAAYYLSPEEVRGEALSPRSNLFSWAAVLYQMVSGHRPFNASDAETLRRKIVEDMPVAPHELDPDIHPRVSEILLKALAKTPEERYGSGAELLTDLENYKRVEAASPKPTAPPKAAGTQIWSPGEGGFPATTTPKKAPAPATQAPAAPAPKSLAAEARPPAKAPVAAASKAESPAAAAAKPAAKATSRNPLFYAMAAGIALLLIVIIAGAYWLRRTPARPAAETTAAAPASNATSPPVPAAAPAAEPVTAPTPSSGSAKAKPRRAAAAAPVAAPPATGGLSLDSSPQGAEVQIDGRHEAAWVTPFTATGLSVGSHTITFSKPGHTAASRTTQVAAGQNAVLAVQLAELAAILSVNSEPAGAAITLDGKDTGKLTPAQLVVAKGSHTVAVHKQGYLNASATLQTAPGQTAQFSPALKLTGSTENIKTVGKFGGIFGGVQENQGRVSVRTNPKGAQVQVNGQPIKKTTPVDFYLNPGSYELSVTLEGYAPVKKIIEVQKGQKLAVDETLSR